MIFIILTATTVLPASDETEFDDYYKLLLLYSMLLKVFLIVTVPLEELHLSDILVNKWRHVRFPGAEKPLGS